MADASDFVVMPRKAAPVADIIEPPAKGQDVSAATADMFTATPRRQESTAASLWNGLLNFGQGVAEGATAEAGKRAPQGLGSEYPGGRSGFAGRAIGGAAGSVAEGLWELIKTPLAVAKGEKNPTAQDALGVALMGTGMGWRNPMGATPAEAFVRLGDRGQPVPLRSMGELTQGGLWRGGPGVEGSAPNPFAGSGMDRPNPLRPRPDRVYEISTKGPPFPPPTVDPFAGGGVERPNPLRPRPPIATPEVSPAPPFPEPAARSPDAVNPLNRGLASGMPTVRPNPLSPREPPPSPQGGPSGLPRGRAWATLTMEDQPGDAARMIRPAEVVDPAKRSLSAEVLPSSSPLANAMVTGDGGLADRTLTNAYRRAVQPKKLGRDASSKGLDVQDQRTITAVDQIIANRPNLRLTDAAGEEVAQQLPQSLRQFAEGIDQTKQEIFRLYDEMAQRAGNAGVRVDLRPVAAHLRQLAEHPQVAHLHPDLAATAKQLADTWEHHGFYSPREAQEVVQNMNQTLAGFWRAPTHETVSRSSLLAPVSTMLRKALDEAIEGSQGPGYQNLRTRYQALRSVERDVANAVQKNANKIPGGIASELADMASAELFLHGILTMNPGAIGRAATTRAAKAAVRYLNDPNRAVTRMFNRRANPIPAGRYPSAQEVGAPWFSGEKQATGDERSREQRLLRRTILPEARP